MLSLLFSLGDDLDLARMSAGHPGLGQKTVEVLFLDPEGLRRFLDDWPEILSRSGREVMGELVEVDRLVPLALGVGREEISSDPLEVLRRGGLPATLGAQPGRVIETSHSGSRNATAAVGAAAVTAGAATHASRTTFKSAPFCRISGSSGSLRAASSSSG
jgi:hypothetical protein